jgi:hypothetical protein
MYSKEQIKALQDNSESFLKNTEDNIDANNIDIM